MDRFVLNLQEDGILLLEDGRIDFCNASLLEMCGILQPKVSLDGQSCSVISERIAFVDSTQTFDELIGLSHSSRKPITDVLVRLEHPQQRKCEVLLSIHPFPEHNVTDEDSTDSAVKRTYCAFRKHSDESDELYWLQLFDEGNESRGSCWEIDIEKRDLIHRFVSKSSLRAASKNPDRQSWYGKYMRADGFFPPDIVEKTFNNYMEALETKKPLEREHIVTQPNGEEQIVIVKFKILGTAKSGNPIGFHSVQNVTQLRLMEKEIAEKRKRLEESVNAMLILQCFFDDAELLMGVVEMDEKPRHVFSNPAVQKLTGKNGEQMKSLPLSQCDLMASELEKVKSVAEVSRETNGPVTFEFQTGDSLGGRIYSAIFHHIRGNQFAYICTDVTAYKKLEAELKRHKEELEVIVETRTKELKTALEVKGRFLAIMSHEIRTPLTGLMGMTSLLSATLSSVSDEVKQKMDTAEVCAGQLMVVINDILDLSKIEEVKMELDNIEFSVCSVLEESMEVASFGCEQKGLELICEMDPNLQDCVIGDPIRLRQILVNLLTNSVKFSSHGEIVVSAYSEQPRTSSIGSESEHDVLQSDESRKFIKIFFSVKDQGIGIAEPNKARILQPFSQADSSITRKYGGSGLGLSISKKLAELMGGSMSFESEEGKGSTFSFSIRVEKGKHVNNPPQLAISEAPHVSIIEPNSRSRVALSRRLSQFNLKNSTYSTPAEFMEASAPNGPMLIILDSKFGLSSIDEIQHRMESSPIACSVIVTAYSRPKDLKPGVEFLKKPIRFKYLLEKMSQMTSAKLGRPSNISSLVHSDEMQLIPSGTKILVCEDNLTNQRVIKQILTARCGALAENITLAENGKVAVDLVVRQRKSYDVILMDLMMPEMSGYEATVIIRTEAPERRIFCRGPPIIALTANAFKEDREKCFLAGMDDVVTKPINAKTLCDSVTKCLNKR
eukprot:TRINITY_DN3905_c0_g1_i2.p1 TRINITY_DN3905_c0_g1~~TRINITY_DN3905_c0_g1_i2.p1  ORF type:complete len:951 (+),score=222.94 TRINITY_DN3905_c0_g1_i2:217-3069(+)